MFRIKRLECIQNDQAFVSLYSTIFGDTETYTQ